MFSLIKKFLSNDNDRLLTDLSLEVNRINNLEENISNLSDDDLKNKTQKFKNILGNGANIENIIHEAFAVVREASKRIYNMRHFDVQILGGLILNQGMIAEMKTGEGKTLAATLPSYLNAISGKGVHIVTVNDYLAERDSEWMGKIYNFLDLSVGCVTANSSDFDRKNAYNSDITYVTNNELGFDFLRDNMKYSVDTKVLRSLNYAIIDEVDSILIDEARTPLIISGAISNSCDLYSVIDPIINRIQDQDYEVDEKLRTVTLTEIGINKIESLLKIGKLIDNTSNLYDLQNLHLVHYINQLLKAYVLFKNNIDYIVKGRKVLIIDEFTGRIMEGRRYSDGLHQAIEAKEKLPIQNENQTLASITFQNFFRMYNKLSGMTGTALTEANELKDIYNLSVIVIPTHKLVVRKDYDDEIYGSENDKYRAIIHLIKKCYAEGQPVLVGTASIEKSEKVSSLLREHQIKHNILNAKFHEQEAYIIAQAGRYKAVTISTNMAGRGTDIQLGGNYEMLIKQLDKYSCDYENQIKRIREQINTERQQVLNVGGLFVIGTERHESRRIDNQLRGRSGRQGDPGSTKFFLSLQDDLVRIFASDRVSSILRTLGLKDGEAIYHPMISKSLEKAQQKVEFNNYEVRKNLLKFDDVMNEQRKILYEQRNNVILSTDLESFLKVNTEQTVKKFVSSFLKSSYIEEWSCRELIYEIHKIFSIKVDLKGVIDSNISSNLDEKRFQILQEIIKQVSNYYESKVKLPSIQTMEQIIKDILLTSLDQLWRDHLSNLEYLRQGISLRAYGQKEPLHEYKREAFLLFEIMLNNLREVFLQKIYSLNTHSDYLKSNLLEKNKKNNDDFIPYINDNDEEFIKNHIIGNKISRNQLCPCRSGRKYKHCHGNKNVNVED